MPNMQLTRNEAVDIAAYVSTLRSAHQPAFAPTLAAELQPHHFEKNA
jgi:hypothetical protein